MSKGNGREAQQNVQFKKNMKLLGKYLTSKQVERAEHGKLMDILHKTQTLFGYIPQEAIDFIAEQLEVPTAHIYGMVTFYNFFSLKPKGKYQISICKGTACYVAGGARILDKLKEKLNIGVGDTTPDGLFSLNITRCLGCCGLSPVLQINDTVYVRMLPEKVSALIDKYRKQEIRLKNINQSSK
ncbi:MAG: NAD(P)H-dependent oxidoreductase subunit E [bacterium]|nr:NAD(P)H-dependent oxidoreductase subunit E [bacterium]